MRPIVDIKSKTFDITNNLLGAGSFSVVKVAYIKGDKKPIALKISHCNSKSEWLQSLNEIYLLKKLVHKNMATLINYEITRFHVLIGLDKGEGTLKQFITKKSSGELKNFAISIMNQIVNGLNYVHSFKIVHGDIKASNIIYNMEESELEIQIMDFGLSHVPGTADSEAPEVDAGGTFIYLAPERLSRSHYDETSDLFSAGIVFFEMLFKKHPFYKDGDNYRDVMKKKPEPKFPEGYQSQVPKEWLVLLCSMLSYNPLNRNEVRNSSVLQTTFSKSTLDHQVIALENISFAEKAENECKYMDSAMFYMQAAIDIGIACHQTDTPNKDFLTDLQNRVKFYKEKAFSLIYLFKHSYFQHEAGGSTSIHDEYYDYLMEVTASTPNLKHYLEIGYNGELYFKESKKDLAFQSFMNALQYLNTAMHSEPPGDRKAVIGKKMLQWTSIAENLRTTS